MAKPKKYISSKLKVKRKFVDGGPWKDTEKELYLNDNVTYQAVDAPTAMLQQQFDANEQLKAKQNTAIFGNQLARQMDYLQDLNADIEKRKKAEETARQQQAEADKQTVNQQVTQTAGKVGKQLVKDYKAGNIPIRNTNMLNDSTNIFSNANIAGGAPLSPTMGTTTTSLGTYSHPFITSNVPLTSANVMPSAPSAVNQFMPQGLNQGTYLTGQGADTAVKTGSAFGQNAAAIGKSLGKSALVALPQIAGQIASNQLNKADDRQMKREGRSEYYDDTDYSRKEFNAQLAKSTGKGATIGGTIGSVVPGIGTGIGMAVGAGVGAIYGTGKALHERRKTKGKNWFGESNVYDENLDPTVIEKRNREAQIKAMTDTATAMDNARMGSMLQTDLNTGFNLKTTTGQMAKYGGKLEYLKGGVAKSLGRGAKEYVGRKHEQGGIDLPGNIEVEGGETEQNNYIFSATLKLPTGITYAQAHKNLLASGASSEEIKQLALSQEVAAGRNPNEIKTMKFAKYGGPLKYDKGGEKQTLKERRKERLVNKFNKKYDAQIQELAELPEDQRAAKFQQMWEEFSFNEAAVDKKIDDAQVFDKTDLFENLLYPTFFGGAGTGALAGPVGVGIGAGIGLGVGAAKSLGEFITSKRGTSRRLDKLEAKKAANTTFEDNLIYYPKGDLANKYVEDFFKNNPDITNAKEFINNYSPNSDDAYSAVTALAAGKYLKDREKDRLESLQNPPVPMKGKDAGKLSRTETPKLAAYTLPDIKVNSNNTSASNKVEESSNNNAVPLPKISADVRRPMYPDPRLRLPDQSANTTASEIQYAGIEPVNEGFDRNTRRNAQLFQDTTTGEYVYRAPDGTEIARSMDQNQAGVERDAYFAKRRNSIGVAPPANNTATETSKTETTTAQNNPSANTTTTNQNLSANTTQNTTTNTTNTTQTNNEQPVVNPNSSGTVTYTTSDKEVTKPTTSPTDNKPRFFMGATRIVDENGNVKVLTDKPLMGHKSMAGSRLGTPTIEGLEDVRTNPYDAAANLKKDEDYKTKVGGASLSFSDAVNDRETIAGTDWGKRWGYRTGMSAAEAQAAHDAFASEMRTKFDQSPDEMLGYYQYLIDSGYTTDKNGKRTYGKDSFGDDARAIYENLKSKGHIDSEGKIKPTALSYLREQATDEFVGPIHNAAGAYTLKGKPTINKIVEDTPPPGPIETPKRDYTMELPPPPKYTPTEFNNRIGLLQTIPAAYAIANPINVKPIAPSLATGYVTPGAVGRANIGRISLNTYRAENQGNLSAMNQALQNMSGPGAVAGMLAAKTKADQQSLAIANAEQNQNTALAAKEAELNAGISKFNVGNAMQAQTTNAGIAQQNAARMQQANQFNTQLKYAKDVENREQILGALDRGSQSIVQSDIDKRRLQSTERLAGIYDAYQAYNRYLGATQAQNNAAKKEEEKTTQAAKFGGAKKYISRLGDLKNVKYKV